MKCTLRPLTILCASALAAATAVAQDQQPPGAYVTTSKVYLWPGYTGEMPGQAGTPYFSGGLGGYIMQDINIHNLGQTVGLDAGVGGSIAGGYNITDALAVGLETGWGWNEMDTGNLNSFAYRGSSTYLYQVPLIANITFKAPLPGGLTPYVGAGYGGLFTTVDTYSRGFWSQDTDVTPVFEGLAGLRCVINKRMEVGVGYRFLASTPHTWFSDSPNLYLATGQTLSHTIMATFTFSY